MIKRFLNSRKTDAETAEFDNLIELLKSERNFGVIYNYSHYLLGEMPPFIIDPRWGIVIFKLHRDGFTGNYTEEQVEYIRKMSDMLGIQHNDINITCLTYAPDIEDIEQYGEGRTVFNNLQDMKDLIIKEKGEVAGIDKNLDDAVKHLIKTREVDEEEKRRIKKAVDVLMDVDTSLMNKDVYPIDLEVEIKELFSKLNDLWTDY